jgi:hypothetical protein
MKKTIIAILVLFTCFSAFSQDNGSAKTSTYQDGYLLKTKVSGLTNPAAEAKINAELALYGTGQNAPVKAANRIFQEDEILIEYNKHNILTYTVTKGSFRSKTAEMDMMNAYRQSWEAFSVSKNLKTGNDISFEDIFKKEAKKQMMQLVRKQLKETYAATPCAGHVFTDDEILKIMDKPCIYEEGIRFQSFACDKDKTNKGLMEIYFSFTALREFINPASKL